MTDLAALPYQRLAHRWPDYRWWRPLVGLVYSLLLYGGLLVVVMIAALAVVAVRVSSGAGTLEEALGDGAIDLGSVDGFTLTMATVIPMLPAALVGFRLAGCKPVGLLSSVTARLRWRWMLVCTGPAAVAVLVPSLVLTLVTAAATGESLAPAYPVAVPLLFLLVVLLVPFQAAAEEYAFRGVLAQTIGAWLRHPAWAILLPVPLFVFAHIYDVPGQISVAVFAIAAGWITWRTGGLEAAIALHVVNNLVAFLLGAGGVVDINATEQGWLSAVAGAATPLLFVLWVDAMWRRRQRRESKNSPSSAVAASSATPPITSAR